MKYSRYNPYVKTDQVKAQKYEEELSRLNKYLLMCFKQDMYYLALSDEERGQYRQELFKYNLPWCNCLFKGAPPLYYVPPFYPVRLPNIMTSEDEDDEETISLDPRDANQTLMKYFGEKMGTSDELLRSVIETAKQTERIRTIIQETDPADLDERLRSLPNPQRDLQKKYAAFRKHICAIKGIEITSPSTYDYPPLSKVVIR